MVTSANIIRIGNSRGIILPSKMLKALKIENDEKLVIENRGREIVISRELEMAQSPFYQLDEWCRENGYADYSLNDIETYAENLRSLRVNKEIKTW